MSDEQYHADFDRDFAARGRLVKRDARRRLAANVARLALWLCAGAAGAVGLMLLLEWL